jgi:TolB-like protein/tetratricopeptide (TPR) repeat protein
MAPEQLRGDRVDARADIFAFGAVLYEMASGLRPFCGQSTVDVMSAILREEPRPLEEVRPGLPARFTRIVKRCLEKDPHRRVQSAIDLRDELQDLAEELHSAQAHAITAAAPPSAVFSGVGAIGAPARKVSKRTLAGVAIAAVAILIAVLIPRGRSSPSVSGDAHAIASLAVLPFDNMTHDASQDYFVEGMHDALITELAKLGVVRVTSRNSVMRYKGQSNSLKEVARQLDVDALIEGAVLREGNRVRITAQLILGRTDEHVWAESYDRDLQDVLALLTGVSHAIAAEVQTRVGHGKPTPMLPEPGATPRIRPEAYEAYLRGRHELTQATSPAMATRALGYFQQAASLDPGFAHAWSGFALVDLLRGFFDLAPAAEVAPIARQAAQNALAIDSREGDAYAVLGALDLYFDWNFTAARSRLEQAVALSPHDMLVRHAYADYLMVTGRFDKSLEQVRLGQRYDPTSPLAEFILLFHTMATRRYEEVIAEGRRALESFPTLTRAHGPIGDALWRQQRYEEALPELKQSFDGDTEGRQLFESAFRRSGPNAAMKAYADHLAGQAKIGRGEAVTIAGYYAEAGERDAAFRWLERAYADRTPQLLHVPANPSFDVVRGDPRFRDLIRRIGIPWTGVVSR